MTLQKYSSNRIQANKALFCASNTHKFSITILNATTSFYIDQQNAVLNYRWSFKTDVHRFVNV